MVKMKNTEAKVTEKLNEKATASVEEAAAKQKETAKERDMITVACGFPMGLKLPLKDGVVVLNGMPLSHIVSAKKNGGFLPAAKFGLTSIKKDQWDEILAKYGKCDFIVNGTIFAKECREEAVDNALEKSEKHLGFEQADPKKARTQKVAE